MRDDISRGRKNPQAQDFFSTVQAEDYIYLRKKEIDSVRDQIIFYTGFRETVSIPTNQCPNKIRENGDYEGWFLIDKLAPLYSGKTRLFLHSCEGSRRELPAPRFRKGQWVSGVVESTEGRYISVEIAPNTQAHIGKNERTKGVEKGMLCMFRIVSTDDPRGIAGDRIFANPWDRNTGGGQSGSFEEYRTARTRLPETFGTHFAFGDCADELTGREDAYKKVTGRYGQEEYLPVDRREFEEIIAADYERAVREKKIITEKGSWTFRSSLVGPDEGIGRAPVFIGFRFSNKERGTEDKEDYFINFAGFKSKGMHRILRTYVYCEDWDEAIKDLKDAALPEDWGKNGRYVYPRLSSYLAFTYYCADIQGKVRKSPIDVLYDRRKRNMMIFNTGLVDIYFKPIYACMFSMTEEEKREKGLGQDYRLYGFGTPGHRELGKMIVSCFDTADLPEEVQYIRNANDIMFDTSKGITLDEEHIVIDNISRLPVRFLLDCCNSDSRCVELIHAAFDNGYNKSEERALTEYLRFTNPSLIRTMTGQIKLATETAILRTKWNYRTALPIYYALNNSLSIILPLCLLPSDKSGSMKTDVALVVSKRPLGSYQGETILTLEMAYDNSRLITRPESDWLIPPAEDTVDLQEEE